MIVESFKLCVIILALLSFITTSNWCILYQFVVFWRFHPWFEFDFFGSDKWR